MTDRSAPGVGVRLVTVDEGHAGQRLDNYLLSLLRGVPRSWVYRVLRRGEVRVNKGRSRPDRRLCHGDVVRIPPVRTAQKAPTDPPAGLIRRIEGAVLFEDERLLVLNKPSGIAVHGGSGLAHGVIEILRASRGEQADLELVHRLDRETSGCLMVAKRRSALRALQSLQRHNAIAKHYQALLLGRIRRDSWRVDLPLRKNILSSGERMVRVDPGGKVASTRFRVLERYRGATRVSAELETGRTHQIRVHALASGHPILGDTKYGDETANRAFRELGLRRLFLHAADLAFTWADGTGRVVVAAPLPEDLSTTLERLDEADGL